MPASFLTVEQVAEALQLAPKTVRRLVGTGELPAVKVAGRLRLDAAGLDAYLAGCRVAVRDRPAPVVNGVAGRPGSLRRALADLDGHDGGR